MRSSRSIFIMCLGIAAIFLLPSCSPANRLEGHVYYRLNANPTTLDPALIVDVQGSTVAAKLFNGLVRLGDNLEVIPDIAKQWSVSKDGLTYRFVLRRGVEFQGGREVTAHDIKYSFERVLNPRTRSPNTWVFDKVEGARDFQRGGVSGVSGFRVMDEDVFEIRLIRPFSPFARMLTMTAAFIVPREEVERRGAEFSSHPSGTGPFVLGEWLPNRHVVLERKDDYFDVRAGVKGIVYRIIPEDLTAVTEFELGNIDVLPLPASAYATFRTDRKWSTHISSLNGLNTYYLGLNTSKAPFNNPALRRAVACAIDREKILRTFYEGRGRLAAGPVPDVLRQWDLSGGGSEFFRYDPAKAGEIVKREGLTGVTVSLYVTADQEVVDLAEIIQAYLAAAGVVVKVKQLEWSAYKEALNRGEPDMFWLSWWADYPDPENFLFPLFHSSNLGPAGNRTRYVNREVDFLIEAGQSATDERHRNAAYRKAEEIIIREAPWVFFWHKTEYLAVQPWIRGYRPYLIYTMDKGTDVGF